MRWRARFDPVLVLVALTSAACGEVSGNRSPVPDPAHWHTGFEEVEIPRQATCQGWFSRSASVPIRLPETGHAVGEVGGRWPTRLIMNLLHNGDLYFRGITWEMPTDDPLQAAVVRLSLRTEVLADLGASEAERPARTRLLVFADRAARWGHVLEVRRALVDLLDPRWQFSVNPRRREDAFSVTVVSSLQGSASGSQALGLVLETLENDTEPASVRVRMPDATYDFPPPRFEEALFVAEANRLWDAMERRLAATTAARSRASLSIPPGSERVPLAFVIKTLDLLLGAGVREVEFPESGITLFLEDMPVIGPEDVVPYPREPLGPPVVLGMLALGVLGMGMTWWPLRRIGKGR